MDQKNKALFASYLNMATCNVDAVLYKIEHNYYPRKQINVGDGLKNLEILQSKDLVTDESVFKQIIKYIPFFNNLLEEKTEKKTFVSNYLSLLFDLRNYYTHVVHNEINILEKRERLVGELNFAFDANIRTVKERFLVSSENDLLHLRRKTKNALNKSFAYNFIDKSKSPTQFSEKGLLFFICQFLEKKYAYLLLKQYSGFKDERENWKKYTLETYTAHCLRLPRERVDSLESSQTLGIDMANELYKCPDLLFDLLSSEEKKKFIINNNPSQSDESLLLKRYKDRFPYFGMRYLDYKNLLPNIHFHIDFGSYFFERYAKTLIDGSNIEDRRLSKRILCFEKIDNAIQKFNKEKGEGLYANKYEDNPEYLNETYPHYHINNNQVGIKMESFFPDLKGKQTLLTAPDAWLSIYEIPQMVYLCQNGQAKNVQNQIKIHIARIKAFFKDVSNSKEYSLDRESFQKTYKIDLYDLPEVFRKEQRNYMALAKDAVQKEIERTEKLITNFNNEQKYTFKTGKKATPRFKVGYIADLLVADFLKFQPSDPQTKGSDKITSPNYQILQASLAYYAYRKEELKEMFTNAGLINNKSKNQHPFLEQCLPLPHTIFDLFKLYFEKKKTYLKGLIDRDNFDVYFLRSYIQKATLDLQKERQKLATSLLDMPINLPRGLFRSLFNNLKEADNPSYYMMQEFIENDDRPQSFYDLPRQYPKRIATDPKKKAQYEQKIRFTKVCDIVMFYMMKDLLSINDPEVKLCLTDEKNGFILDQTINNLSTKYNDKYALTGDMKIRDYGNFKRLMFDKRLSTYCQYFSEGTELKYNKVEKEFEYYDLSRIEIFKKIHEFEKVIIDKHQMKITKDNNRIEFAEIVSKATGLNENEQNRLSNIRNAFSHHDYLKPNDFTCQDKDNLTKEMVSWCIDEFQAMITKAQKA